MGMQGLTTAATGPLDQKDPSDARLLLVVMLEASMAGCTCPQLAGCTCQWQVCAPFGCFFLFTRVACDYYAVLRPPFS